MRHWMRGITLPSALVASLAAPTSAAGQEGKLWIPVVVSVAPEKRPIRVHLELQPRFDDGVTGAEALLVRSAVGLELRPNWSMLVGHAWVPSFRSETSHEQRTWQQLRYGRERQPREYEFRGRLEQRYLPDDDGTSWRLRARAHTAIEFAPGWRWAVGNELFVTLNETTPGEPRGVGQNRFEVGVNREIVTGVSLQPRYMAQYERRTSSGATDVVNHVLMVGLDITLPR